MNDIIARKGRFSVRLESDNDAQAPSEEQDRGLFIVAGHRDFYVPAPGEKRVRADFAEYVSEYKATHWIIPVEAYIHSGVALYLSGGCSIDRNWDVSQVGAVFASKKEWRLRKSALKAAKGLIEYWNQYLSGDVWGYVIVEHEHDGEDGKIVDAHAESCWGFFGREYAEKQAREALELHTEHADTIPTLKAIGVS